MTGTNLDAEQCPKFEKCSAPICPLDPDWRLRHHYKGERVCFYLTEYSKPAARAFLRGSLARKHYQALARVYPEAITHVRDLQNKLQRSAQNPPRVGRRPGGGP